MSEPDKKTPEKRKVGDGTPGPGRPPGVPNKFTGALKEMVRQALDEAGGVEYLKTQAEKNPSAFLTLVGKLLPAEINAKVAADVGPEMMAWLDKRS